MLLQCLQDDLHHQRQKYSDLVALSEQKDSNVSSAYLRESSFIAVLTDGCKCSEQIESLQQEIQCVREEKVEAQSSAGKEELVSAIMALTAERDQLKMDLQENVEMVS